MDFSTFQPLDPQKLNDLDDLLQTELPRLLKQIPDEQLRMGVVAAPVAQVTGRPSPFAVMKIGGASEQSVYKSRWHSPPVVADHVADFEQLGPKDGGDRRASQGDAGRKPLTFQCIASDLVLG